MFRHRIVSLLLVAVLAGVAGFVLGRTLGGNRVPAVPASPESQALSGRDTGQLPGTQPSPNTPMETPPASRQSSAPAGVATSASPGESKTPITVANNRLSVQVQNRSLAGILDEISNQSGIPILLGDGINDQTVSMRFQDLPLDQGLQALLKTFDAFFFYSAQGAQGQAPAALKAVWIYPQGQGHRIMPVPPETYASTAEMQQNLRDPDPDQRARAAEVLIERQGTKALDTVLEVLEDPDEKVRYRALNQAVQLNLALPEDLIQRLALSDSSPVVRFLALEAMVNAPSIDPERLREIAERALNDPSEEVKAQAEDILTTLDSDQQPEDDSEPLQGEEEEKSD
jgi:hypothetical protein